MNEEDGERCRGEFRGKISDFFAQLEYYDVGSLLALYNNLSLVFKHVYRYFFTTIV